MPKLFCARCGKELNQKSILPGYLCPSCYLEAKIPLSSLPKIEVVLCPQCLSFMKGKQWIRTSAKDLIEAAFKAILQVAQRAIKSLAKGLALNFSLDKETLKPLYTSSHIQVKLKVIARSLEADISKMLEQDVTVYLRLCPQCSMTKAGGFEAVVQVRADGRSLREADVQLVNGLLQRFSSKYNVTERGAYLVEVKEVHGGLDVKFSSATMAKRFAEELRNLVGAMVKYSYKVRGINSSGKTSYYTTISVRFPQFSLGEVVRYKGELVLVKSFDRDQFIAISLRNRRKVKIPFASVWKEKEVITGFPIKMFSVLSIHGDTATLLNLESNEVQEIPAHMLPPWIKVGDRIRAVEHDGKILIVSGLEAKG